MSGGEEDSTRSTKGNLMTSTWIPGLRPDPGQPIPDRLSPPELVAMAEREIGAPATLWAAQTAGRIVDEVTARFRASASPAMVTGSEREGCEASLLTVLVALHKEIPSVARSGSATESVRRSVHRGVAINTVLKTVWACHAMVQDALLTEAEKVLPGERLLPEIRRLNRAMTGYITSYAGELLREYEEEAALWKGRIPAEQLRIFTSLVEGSDPGANAEEVLGIRLTDSHLIAAIWSRAGGRVPDKDAATALFANNAGDTLGAARTLILPQDDGTRLWWSWRTTPTADLVESLRRLARPPWMNLAVGTLAPGPQGVLGSYRACRQAERVGRTSGVDTFWPYEDLSVVALMSADEDAARRFTRSELAGLSAPDAKTATLRETLRIYLKTGASRPLTAQNLYIAVNTVSYRIARTSDLLGRSAVDRAMETLLALELAHYFPDFLT